MKKQIDFRHLLLSVGCLCGFFNALLAQEDQTVPTAKRNDYKNVVKFNLSSQILYDNTFLVGYERVINQHQTLNISGGYLEFPISLDLPEYLQMREQRSKSGYNLGVDWRFYLANENKHLPPHGLYLAPFISIHHFKNVRDITYTDTLGNVKDAVMNSGINFFTIGGQLGYQFVIKRRFVIDAVLVGPGVTNYRFKVKLDGNLTDADKQAISEKIIEALHAKLPLLDEFAKGEEVSGSGVQSFWSAGFRYSLSIGFRF